MQVTTVTITRSRKVQPEQYGAADAAINVSANVDEGETWQEVARSLLTDARSLVYDNLGKKLPQRVVDELAQKDTPQETTTVAVETAPAEEPAKPRRGRRPNKDKAAEAAAAVASDIPGEETTPQIRTNPEDRKDPTVSDDIPGEVELDGAGPADESIPGEETAPAADSADDLIGEYSVSDLQSFLTEAVKAKKVSAQKVREIISSHNVARTSDLPADKVLVVKQQIEKEMASA